MLLALPSPVKHPFEQRSVSYDLVAQKLSIAGASSQLTPAGRYSLGSRQSASRPSPTGKMTTPHRNLPPPAPLSFSEPIRLQTSTTGQQQTAVSLHGMPAPPPQMPGMEEAMRHWLGTKAEEEKRRQEEEKTRQETLRLEQKKIEQSMLLEVIRSQVPFHLIPAIFLTLGNASMSMSNSELLQQSIAQIVGYQPTMMPPSAEAQRERQGSFATGQSLPATPHEGPYSAMSTRAGTMSGPPSAQRTHFSSVPPRMKALDVSSAVASSQISPQQPEQAPILFHHWQPPSTANEPATSVAPSATSASAEQVSSPRKRKAPGPHQPASMPPSTLRYSEVSESSRPHTRHRSDTSSRSILHPSDEKIMTRSRADTAINDETLTPEQHWSSRRPQASPKSQQHRLQYHSQPYGEASSFANQEDMSGRSSRETARPVFVRRSPEQDKRATGIREDVEMHER